MKKLLYTLLVATMVLGVGGASFAAAGDIAPAPFSDIAGHEAEGELTLMASLGIFQGSGGLARPDDPITRAEFCKVVVLAIGRGSTAAGLAGLQPTFTDGASIPTWAWGFVNVATYTGIIYGYADGSFGPNNPVTYGEAVTMLVRAVPGHAAQVPAGVWPYNYLFYGVDAEFTGSVDVGFASLPCTRGDMARMLFATMQVDQLYASGESAGTTHEGTAILTDRLFSGTFYYNTMIGPGDPWIELYGPDGGLFFLGDPVYMVGGGSYEDLMGLSVIAVTDEPALGLLVTLGGGPPVFEGGKCVFLWKTEGNSVSGVFSDYYDNPTNGLTYLELADGTRVPLPDNSNWEETGWESVPVNLNGRLEAAETPRGRSLTEGDEVTINLDDAGVAVSVAALRWDLIQWAYDRGDALYTMYYHDVITGVDKSTETESENTEVTFFDSGEDLDAFWYAYSPGDVDHNEGMTFEIDETTRVYLNGKPSSRDDLAPYDVLKMASWGAWGYDAPWDVFAVSATRAVLDVTVTGSNAVYPGPKIYGTYEGGDATKTFRLDATEPESDCPKYLVGRPPEGLHSYLLDEDGLAFFDKGYDYGYSIVLITGAETRRGSEGEEDFVIVDNRGVEMTYPAEYSCVDGIGYPPLVPVFDPLSGAVEDFVYPMGFPVVVGFPAFVCSIGADSLTIGGDGYLFLHDPVVYADETGWSGEEDFADAEYIGLAGLAVDDEVLVFVYDPVGEGNPDDYVYAVIRDDSPEMD